MNKAYTIKLLVPDGDPKNLRIVEKMNWTGKALAFPRSHWPVIKSRPDFDQSGVYILSGYGEDQDKPTIYVGQTNQLGKRLSEHDTKPKSSIGFWENAFVFTASHNALNPAYTLWLERALIDRATQTRRAFIANTQLKSSDLNLSETDIADVSGFFAEMLQIFPLIGTQIFEPSKHIIQPLAPSILDNTLDTVVVPALRDGFEDVFIGLNMWRAIRISNAMLERIKYLAVYQSAPISAVTHVAEIASIEAYGDTGKYQLNFRTRAVPLAGAIPFGNAKSGSMQGPRYTKRAKLESAKTIADLFS